MSAMDDQAVAFQALEASLKEGHAPTNVDGTEKWRDSIARRCVAFLQLPLESLTLDFHALEQSSIPGMRRIGVGDADRKMDLNLVDYIAFRATRKGEDSFFCFRKMRLAYDIMDRDGRESVGREEFVYWAPLLRIADEFSADRLFSLLVWGSMEEKEDTYLPFRIFERYVSKLGDYLKVNKKWDAVRKKHDLASSSILLKSTYAADHTNSSIGRPGMVYLSPEGVHFEPAVGSAGSWTMWFRGKQLRAEEHRLGVFHVNNGLLLLGGSIVETHGSSSESDTPEDQKILGFNSGRDEFLLYCKELILAHKTCCNRKGSSKHSMSSSLDPVKVSSALSRPGAPPGMQIRQRGATKRMVMMGGMFSGVVGGAGQPVKKKKKRKLTLPVFGRRKSSDLGSPTVPQKERTHRRSQSSGAVDGLTLSDSESDDEKGALGWLVKLSAQNILRTRALRSLLDRLDDGLLICLNELVDQDVLRRVEGNKTVFGRFQGFLSAFDSKENDELANTKPEEESFHYKRLIHNIDTLILVVEPLGQFFAWVDASLTWRKPANTLLFTMMCALLFWLNPSFSSVVAGLCAVLLVVLLIQRVMRGPNYVAPLRETGEPVPLFTILRGIQNTVGGIVTVLLKLQGLVTWLEPSKTRALVVVLILVAALVYFVPFRYVVLILVINQLTLASLFSFYPLARERYDTAYQFWNDLSPAPEPKVKQT